MITRIFRVRIDPSLRTEFEEDFKRVSIAAVQAQDGFISVEIGQPTAWTPDEYVMISRWENEAALRNFVGENWNEAHIPDGMEKYVGECWVHHFREF